MTSPSPVAWRCAVCGYVHRGASPPASCPICGADRKEFEAYSEPPAAPAESAARRWRCLNCGYVHEGDGAPAACPICGASRERFEPAGAEAIATGGGLASGTVVVLGAGIAGISAVESIRRASPQARIILVSKEAELPYYRLNLTRYLAGEIRREELPIHGESWYRDRAVELLLGAEAAALDPSGRRVELRDGAALAFDKLVLTAGAHPFLPPLPGAQREGVTALRTTGDTDRILVAARPGAQCLCIGGGILGLETAGALARRGLDVTLLEGHGWLMPRQLNRRAGKLLAGRIAAMGIRLATQARSREIVGDERAAGVLLEDGRTLPGELVVIATGIRPNSFLARRAGLEVNQGVVVDYLLRTSCPDVLAAGDVAEARGVLYGNWSAAQYQGGIAGMNAAGAAVEFGGIPRSNTLKVLGIDLVSIGQFEPADGSYEVIEQEADGSYLRFVCRDGCLVGAVLLGDASASPAAKKAIERHTDLSGLLSLRPGAVQVAEHLRGL